MNQQNFTVLVLIEPKAEKPTLEEIKEVLQNNDGDLERLNEFKDANLIWGYLCKIEDYFRFSLMDMDKVLLFVDEEEYVYSYEHTGNYYPTDKTNLRVVGLMDENAEIEPTERVV